MVKSDEWTRYAMRDGEVVAELLVTLKEAKVANPTVASLRWGIRQPRSRSPKKEAESRCSPSTPLSWSGGYGASSSSSPPPFSTYLDVYEATSRRISTVGSTSKVLVPSDLDFDVKRLQKKKDIALVRSPFIENKNMKRMKMDHSQSLAKDDNCKAGGNFLLPDLNIMPCEETGDHYMSMGVETTLYGIRITRVQTPHKSSKRRKDLQGKYPL